MDKTKDIYLTDERYLAALKRIRQLIADGRELYFENSNKTGNKYNFCTWGLCAIDKEVWSDKEDMLFPDQYPNRCTPKYFDIKKGQHCPLDSRHKDEDHFRGCFWTCRIFQSINKMPKRKQALEWFDEQIKHIKGKINHV